MLAVLTSNLLDSAPSISSASCLQPRPYITSAWGWEEAADTYSGPGVNSPRKGLGEGWALGVGGWVLSLFPVLTLLFQVVGRGHGSSIINMII